MSSDTIAQARANLPGEEAALLVRTMIERQVKEQDGTWARIERVVAPLKRRGEINHFSEGIAELRLRVENQ